MNIYVIYKFADYELVKPTIDQIKKKIPDSDSIFMFDPNRKPKLWHYHALKKIKESHMVILFDSLPGDGINVGKHICWELKQAEKYQKQIVVFKTHPDATDRSWYVPDYSEKDPLHPRYNTIPVTKAIEYMEKECNWLIDDNLLRETPENTHSREDMQLLMEQYRIMIETSEKLMERRQETVGLYTTLCTALLALIGASFAFEEAFISGLVLLICGLILVILCRNWRLSLESYDLNNTGKFKVINLIEKKLPADMFECEYRFNKINGIRSFSTREKMLPTIFSIFGYCLMGFSLLYFIYKVLAFWGLLPF